MRNRWVDSVRKVYGNPYCAYYVGCVGNASLQSVKRYVETQGTQEKPRKAAKRPPACLSPGFAWEGVKRELCLKYGHYAKPSSLPFQWDSSHRIPNHSNFPGTGWDDTLLSIEQYSPRRRLHPSHSTRWWASWDQVPENAAGAFVGNESLADPS